MSYDNIKAAPTYLPFQTDISFDVSGAVSNTYLDTSAGSAFGAVSGYLLNNRISTTSARVRFYAGGTILKSLNVKPAQYQAFFCVGADQITVYTTNASNRLKGEIHMVFNANPM